MKTVYKIICEWDIGLEDKIYLSKDKALQAIVEADLPSMGIDEPLSELIEEGLLIIKPVKVNI